MGMFSSIPDGPLDAEVWHIDEFGALVHQGTDGPGWYFWFCRPGCLPDTEPYGPFTTQEQAIHACREMVNE